MRRKKEKKKKKWISYMIQLFFNTKYYYAQVSQKNFLTITNVSSYKIFIFFSGFCSRSPSLSAVCVFSSQKKKIY